MEIKMNRANRRSPWTALCARLTIAAFAASLPGPAAWAQVVERVAPVTATAISASAGASLAAPSVLAPSPISALSASGAATLSAPALSA
ncbi:MAG TPA: hypothetical protein VH309_08035, partial [Elusimicrobiota bacterium]|nr:hypothetical protein [Elusimicrobiota bacterium]